MGTSFAHTASKGILPARKPLFWYKEGAMEYDV